MDRKHVAVFWTAASDCELSHALIIAIHFSNHSQKGPDNFPLFPQSSFQRSSKKSCNLETIIRKVARGARCFRLSSNNNCWTVERRVPRDFSTAFGLVVCNTRNASLIILMSSTRTLYAWLITACSVSLESH